LLPVITPPRINTYIIDTSGGTEVARLMKQSQLLTRSMGGVFPELGDELTHMHSILDLACGPGGWVLDAAYAYPNAEVVGIDIDASLVQYARAHARVQGLENATFQDMDITRPLAFPDHSVDLVNARFLFSVLYKNAWTPLVAECLRILRPGGVLRLTEMEKPICNAAAGEQMSALLAQALFQAGRSFSPDGCTIGITPLLGKFLREAGFERIEQQPHTLECSNGTPLHVACCENGLVGAQLLKPLYLSMGVITEEAFEALYQQTSIEVLSDDFCGPWPMHSAWGRKRL
jgi:ubiquinone/menaquinone biosynthesis C-methylase UbiE